MKDHLNVVGIVVAFLLIQVVTAVLFAGGSIGDGSAVSVILSAGWNSCTGQNVVGFTPVLAF